MMRGVVAFIVGVADLAGEIIARESISLRLANIAEHQAQLDGFCSRPIEGGNPIRVEVGQLLAALFEIEQARHDRNEVRAAQWCVVAFVLLQMVRDNVVEAMKHAAEHSRVATTDHDFKRRG